MKGNGDILVTLRAIVLTLVLLLPSISWCGDLVGFNKLEVDALFSPPHNENIIQDRVERYRLVGRMGVYVWKFNIEYEAILRGVNEWRTPDEVGHGFPEAWRGSNWGIDRFRLDHALEIKLPVWRDKLYLISESARYYYPDREYTGHHASEYWLEIGIRYKFL